MPADVEAVRTKVQALLTAEGPVQLDKDGDFSILLGSARCYVSVVAHPNGEVVIVKVFSPLVVNITPSPELFEYIARSNYFFGHLYLATWEGGRNDVIFGHTLLGDYLDREELLYALYGVAGTADELDDEIVGKLGGTRFTDS